MEAKGILVIQTKSFMVVGGLKHIRAFRWIKAITVVGVSVNIKALQILATGLQSETIMTVGVTASAKI